LEINLIHSRGVINTVTNTIINTAINMVINMVVICHCHHCLLGCHWLSLHHVLRFSLLTTAPTTALMINFVGDRVDDCLMTVLMTMLMIVLMTVLMTV
jgi:hypothetical protein